MANAEQTRQVYERLADWYDHENQPKLRDWFLVLAADTAQTAGQADEAERLRGRLLQRNPHHLLKPFASFAEALRSPDVQGYIADLRRTYPPAAAEQLLLTHQAQGSSASATAPPAPPAAAPKPAAAAKPSPAAPPAEEPELKVYRVRAEPEEAEEPVMPMPRQAPPPRPAPRQAPPAPARAAPPPRPAPAQPRPRPAPVEQPAANLAPTITRATTPAHVPGGVAPKAPPPAAGAGVTAGAWLPAALFVILLVLSLWLAVYTLGRPFLPEDWFR